MTCKAFDVVTIPFPFTDAAKRKKRPALVLSSSAPFNDKIDHSVMAMITSAKNRPWPLDVKIVDLERAGLSAESVVRMKLFTLDHRFVLKKIGSLTEEDQKAVVEAVSALLSDLFPAEKKVNPSKAGD